MPTHEHPRRGNELLEQGLVQQAIDSYSAALDLEPQRHAARCNRAAAWGLCGRWDLSARDAQEVTRLAPQLAKGWYRLGVAQAALGQLQQARSSLSQAGASCSP
jgi:stress-induced-phosphoprotein 1